MTETEEYFPRGKVAPAVAKAAAANGDQDITRERKLKRKSKDKLDNLFVDTFDDKREERKTKRKSKNALTPEEAKALGGKRRSDEKRFAVVPLTYDQIVEGMLSLGIISKIHDHEIFVTLPGRTIGVVSITNISTPYLDIIEKHASGKGDKDEDIALYTLKEMFYVGQSVVVKVKDVQREESRVKLVLSMNPKDIYENYSTTILKQDLVMVAAVASEEDHGYVMDIGINGARCFLSREDANKFIKIGNFNRKLGIGQLVYCKINNVNIHRLIADVKLTTFPKAVKAQKMDDVIGLNYSTLIPGMLVDAIVMKTHKTGVMAHCLELNGLVHQDHMSNEWSSAESLEIGSTVPARILYILPNLTTPYLTLQSELVPLIHSRDLTNRDKLGSKEAVRVVRTERRGLVVKIEDGGYKGLVPLYHLGNETLLTTEDISKSFKDNSVHDARILNYCPFERMYMCSFKKEHLENDIVHLEKANEGKRVTCQILRWNKGGALVSYSIGMHGFIPNTLFRSEKLTEAAKEKLIGSTHKARIFCRDIEKERVLLTVRKEFVKSNGAVIEAIKEGCVGLIGHAMIKSFNDVGAYVTTLGGVEGFIPSSKLSKQRLLNFKEVFHHGQIVEYKVIGINTEKNHLVLSLILDAEPDENKKTITKRGLKRKSDSSMKESSVTENEESVHGKKKRRKRRKKPRLANSESSNTGNGIKGETSDDDEALAEKTAESKVCSEGLDVPEKINFWETSATTVKDSDDSDSDDEMRKHKKKKATLKIGVPLDLLRNNHAAETIQNTIPKQELVAKYEKGIISNPNDPSFWTSLMTHYSSIGIVEKARAVAKQALDMINYRDEKAKLKIWGALFKLEVKYGTEETLKSTLSDALQRTDQFECLKLIALVYDNANRFKDAEKTYRQIVKQYRLEPDAWIRFGNFYYLRKKFDAARELLNEALTSIPSNKHIFLISKFALLELHFGERTRGEPMLDHILAQNPTRADLWLLYVNALIKLSDYDCARAVFRRAFEISWNPKKVKPLLKRFQEFETTHGTDDTKQEFHKLALKVLNFTQAD